MIKKLSQRNTKKKNKKKKKILILSNRRALIEQTANELEKNLKNITQDWEKMVEVCSYQSFLNSVSEFNYEKIQYVVLDECHFFLSDAEFNPYTGEILQTVIKKFSKSIRIYMSATMEEVFYPIFELERKKYEKSNESDENFVCKYYYFERNYDYIEKFYAYDDLKVLSENIVEQIKENPKERWLIFVSSKKDGKNLLQNITGADENESTNKISCVFLTAESKNASETSKEYITYREIVENEKFSPQILISTSVLDNGVNIKDSSVKNVVVDLLDKTEMIQMLGRVRVECEQTINLYIRNYSEEDIKKFLLDDVKKMIFRLRTDFVTKERYKYYDKLLRESEYQYKMWHLFYHNGNKNQVFDYNDCAIYRLINRLTEFIKLINKITHEGYYIDPDDFVVSICKDRAGIFEKFYAKNQKRYSKYWAKKIMRILEIEENIDTNSNSNILYFTFENYLKEILIPEKKKGSEHSFGIPLSLNIISPFSNDNPILYKQMEWLGIDEDRMVDIKVLQGKSTLIIPDITDEEVLEILNTVAISQTEYQEHTENEKKSTKSGGIEYIPFKDKDILEEKGVLKSDFNKAVHIGSIENIEEKNIGNLEKFIKIIYWISKKIDSNDPQNLLLNIFDDESLIKRESENYKIKIVRGTQKGFQKDYVIIVKNT